MPDAQVLVTLFLLAVVILCLLGDSGSDRKSKGRSSDRDRDRRRYARQTAADSPARSRSSRHAAPLGDVTNIRTTGHLRVRIPVPAPGQLARLRSQGHEDINEGERWRAAARSEGDLMAEARSQARIAREAKNYDLAKRFDSEAQAHRSAMEILNQKAAKAIYEEKNKGLKEGEYDLHGLTVPEAVQFSSRELQSAVARKESTIRFIVGKGLHSDAGGAKIRPALEEFLGQRSMRYALDPSNAGVLVVNLS
ncbi:hypothetical protein BC834DRAFT_842058 [Gloeopeniophorella convolvens]|nr:hypothetical protein BC834DRAFT_842058 [Gloeopeniophorella convolvens]